MVDRSKKYLSKNILQIYCFLRRLYLKSSLKKLFGLCLTFDAVYIQLGPLKVNRYGHHICESPIKITRSFKNLKTSVSMELLAWFVHGIYYSCPCKCVFYTCTLISCIMLVHGEDSVVY